MFRKLSQLWKSGTAPETAQNVGVSDTELLAQWTTRTLDGRRLDVFVPATSQPLLGAVLFLHGHGRVFLNGNPVFTRLFHDHCLAVVCPDGGGSWWLDVPSESFGPTLTAQQWLTEQAVTFVMQELLVPTPLIALLGVSMGGQGALQLAYRHALRFPVVAAISPAVDFHQLYGSGIELDRMFDSAESARQATAVLNLHPLSWPRYQYFCCDPADHDWFDGAARLGMKLSSSGILHERDFQTSGGGHSWEYFNRMASAAVGHIATSLKKLRNEMEVEST